MGSLSPVQKMMLARLMAGQSPYPESPQGEPMPEVFRAPSHVYRRKLASELGKLVKVAQATAEAWTNLSPEDQALLRKELKLPCGCSDPFEKVDMLRTWHFGLKDLNDVGMLLSSSRALIAGNGPSPGKKKRR